MIVLLQKKENRFNVYTQNTKERENKREKSHQHYKALLEKKKIPRLTFWVTKEKK